MSVFSTIPSDQWIASSSLAFAIWDLHPVTPGYALVIPKRPVRSRFDASAQDPSALLSLVAEVKRLIEDLHHPDGYNVNCRPDSVTTTATTRVKSTGAFSTKPG